EELAYRFYQVTSERRLALITEKPKDRYYRLLDAIYTNKREIENLIYYALINSGKIIKKEVKIDITSTYFEGNNLSIALFCYSRDHREDRRQVVILLVLVDDYPLFTYVFEGNKKDWTVLLDVIKDVKERIGCSKITIVCDRGFFKEETFEKLEAMGVYYIMAIPRRIGKWKSLYDNGSMDFYHEGRRCLMYENTELRKELLSELEETLESIRRDMNVLTPSELRRKYKHAIKFVDIKKIFGY
ncbi:MAG: transposase, partial [Thermoplasmata archaeon]